jgi:hypothetical protein
MADFARAFLNLLSGGSQGFAEAQKRRQQEDSDAEEKDKERKFQANQTGEELAFRRGESRRSEALNREQMAGEERRFSSEQRRRGEESAAEAKYRQDSLKIEQERADTEKARSASQLKIEELNAKVARIQLQKENEFDPYLSIQKAVNEVYIKNATGDTPEIAGQIAAKAAIDLTKIYQAAGIIGTPIGPTYEEGTVPPPVPGTNGEGDPYLTLPGITFGRGQIGFGGRAEALKKQFAKADSLRSVNAVNRR